jgi:hypothetical protein
MQDGVPPHFALPAFAWLDNHFSGGWIGRRGQTEWSPQFPILLRFIYFCGVGRTRKPRALDELEQQIREFFFSF